MGVRWHGKPPEVFCCRAGDETEELDLKEQWKKKWFVCNIGCFLAGLAYGLIGAAWWIWGLGKSN